MKRSKIISLISDYFYECNGDSIESEILAKDLLNNLEKAGMLPPGISYEDQHFSINYCNCEWDEE